MNGAEFAAIRKGLPLKQEGLAEVVGVGRRTVIEIKTSNQDSQLTAQSVRKAAYAVARGYAEEIAQTIDATDKVVAKRLSK